MHLIDVFRITVTIIGTGLVQGISFSLIICFGSHFFLFHPHPFAMVVVTGIDQTKKVKGEGEIKIFDLHLLQKRKG